VQVRKTGRSLRGSLLSRGSFGAGQAEPPPLAGEQRPTLGSCIGNIHLELDVRRETSSQNGGGMYHLMKSFLFLLLLLLGCSSTNVRVPEKGMDLSDNSGTPIMIKPGMLKYPLLAQRAGLEGRIVADVFIDTTGTVYRVAIIERQFNYSAVVEHNDTTLTKDIFDQPTIDFFMESTFRPARIDNKVVGVEVTIPLRFRLDH